MATPLLQTKLYIPPLRRERVPRPRLIERLDAGLRRKLTLVSAPAGFGKTTVLSEWIAGCERPVAWLSLDSGDNDPTRFWRYVVAALQIVQPDLGQVALSMLQPTGGTVTASFPIEAILTALINEISEGVPSALVLDDYHTIEALSIHDGLAFLLDHLPPQMHLIVASRADPPLPLSRLRGRNQVTELRADDLRFAPDEVAAFFGQVMDLELSTKDIVVLGERTEGWIVGLQMAALALQGTSMQGRRAGQITDFIMAFTGGHRYVLDYFTDEVLLRQPQEVQTFLFQTSILNRLCGSLCDAVLASEPATHPAQDIKGVQGVASGRLSDSRAILEYLERANLFIVSLDDERRWYRYHHLFADLLRKRLRGAQPDLVPVLHSRASRWYEGEGLVAEAVWHALAAPDYTRAADLIEQDVEAMLSRGEGILAFSWLKPLPEDVIRSRPLLCVACAWATLMVPPHSIEQAEGWMQDAEAAAHLYTVESPFDSERTVRYLVTSHAATFRAIVARWRRCPPQEVIDLSLQGLEVVSESDLGLRSILVMQLGLAYLDLKDEEAADRAFAQAVQMGQDGAGYYAALTAVYARAAVAREHGRLRRAAAICREGLASIIEPVERAGRRLPIAGAIYITLGRVLLEWNDLEQAERFLSKGLELSEWIGGDEAYFDGNIALARLRLIQGDVSQVSDLSERVGQAAPRYAAYVDAHQVRMWLMQAGRDPRLSAAASWLAKATRWVEDRQLALDDDGGNVAELLTLARVLIAQHRILRSVATQADFQVLLRFLDRQLELAKEQDWVEQMIEILILQALALQVQGEGDRALLPLEHALDLGRPEGYVRIFVDEGAPMRELLRRVIARRALARDILAGYASKLLMAMESERAGRERGTGLGPTSPASEAERLVEPLNERELQVLRLLAGGMSNREIADELILALGTVKKHTSNIYGKLSVHKRTQAVVRARELGLL